MSNNRKRTANNHTKEEAALLGLSDSDPRDPNAETRPPRVSMDSVLNFDMSAYNLDHKKFYYRGVAEHPNRPGKLARAKQAYYEHETDHEGNIIQMPSGDGVLYLMRLLWKYRKEDVALKEKKVYDMLEDEAKLGPGEYAPDPVKMTAEGGTTAVTSEDSGNHYS